MATQEFITPVKVESNSTQISAILKILGKTSRLVSRTDANVKPESLILRDAAEYYLLQEWRARQSKAVQKSVISFLKEDIDAPACKN